MALEALFSGNRSKQYSPLGEFLASRFGAPGMLTGASEATPKPAGSVSLQQSLGLSAGSTGAGSAPQSAPQIMPYSAGAAALPQAGAAPQTPGYTPAVAPFDPSIKAAGNYDPVISAMEKATALANSGQDVDYGALLASLSAAAGAASDTEIANAEEQALKNKRSVLGAFGDRSLAEKVLGGGDPILGSISADPDKADTTLARIARNYRETTHNNEEELNLGNLWYGGQHGKVLKDLAQQNDSTIHDATGQVQSTLDQITNALAAAKSDAIMRKLGLLQSLFAGLRPRTSATKPQQDAGPAAEIPTVVSGFSPELPALQGEQLGHGYKRPGGF